MAVRVEFYGIPRERAGVGAIEVPGDTLGELFSAIAVKLPALAGDVIVGDTLQPHFSANLNGERFVTDPKTPLSDNDCILILSADAGG